MVGRPAAHLLPGLGRVGLARGVHGGLELVQPHQRGRQAAPGRDVRKHRARRLEQALLEAAVAHRLRSPRPGIQSCTGSHHAADM